MACDPKSLVSSANCFLCLSVLQLQAIKTLQICSYNPTPPIPTPVLSVDFSENLSWVSALGAGQNTWKIYKSVTAVGGFSLSSSVGALTTTLNFGDNLWGYFWYVVGTNVSNEEVTNPSNVVQAPPQAVTCGDFDSPEFCWTYSNPNLPAFWSIYHYNGSGNVNDPANYTFLASVTGDNSNLSDGLNRGDTYIVRGTATDDGLNGVTVYSNPAVIVP